MLSDHLPPAHMEVRAMMRLASAKHKMSASSNSADAKILSGKEKAQILKLLKGKKSEEDVTSQKAIVRAKHSSNTHRDVGLELEKRADSSTSVIPEDFFDSAEIKPETNSTVLKSAVKEASAIPSGFFDDPVDDLNARGLTIKQQIARQKEIEISEMKSFLNEIGKIDEDTSLIDAELEEEFSTRDFEEASVQMAYITKLAKLYKQSDFIKSGKALDSSNESKLSSESFESELKSAESESAVLIDSESSGATAILEIVNKKLADAAASKKRKLENFNEMSTDEGMERPRFVAGENEPGDSDGAAEDSDDDNSSQEYDPLSFM